MVVVLFKAVKLTFKPSHQNRNTHTHTHSAHIQTPKHTCKLQPWYKVCLFSYFTTAQLSQQLKMFFSLFPTLFLFYYFYFSPLPLAPHSPLLYSCLSLTQKSSDNNYIETFSEKSMAFQWSLGGQVRKRATGKVGVEKKK